MRSVGVYMKIENSITSKVGLQTVFSSVKATLTPTKKVCLCAIILLY